METAKRLLLEQFINVYDPKNFEQTIEDIANLHKEIANNSNEEQLQKELNELLKEGQAKTLDKEKLNKWIKDITIINNKINNNNTSDIEDLKSDILSFYDEYLEQEEKENDSDLRLDTGLSILKFGEEEYNINLPRGAISVVAGRPSHGKTALLTNIALNLANSDKKVLFLTYEELEKNLIKRAISTNEDKRRGLLTKEELENKTFELLKGKDWKLRFKYIGYDIDKLISYLDSIFANNISIDCLVIDYLQKIPMPKAMSRTANRQVVLQEISNKLLQEVAIKYNISVLCGCQLSRQQENEYLSFDNLREAGDIEQDANLILGIWNYRVGEAQKKKNDNSQGKGKNEEGNKSESQRLANDKTVKIQILKNRHGIANEDQHYTFNGETGKISIKKPEEKNGSGSTNG